MFKLSRLFLMLFSISVLKENEIHITAFRVFQVNGEETILAVPNEKLNIECKTDMPMAYCVFKHPNGMRYSYSGPSLNIGQCVRTIKAAKNDTGTWRCHVGTTHTGLEIMQKIQVRVVTSAIAAIQDNIKTVHGKPVTLACATVRQMTPLSYCRFEPPNGQPFSINSEDTAQKPILNRYYFPKNKSLDRGDCAVTIRKVKYEDLGLWTCGAGLSDGQEHIDVINIDVEGLYTMSTASATGITFGVIFVVGVLAVLGFIAWKKRTVLGIRRVPDVGEPHELEHLPTTSTSTQSPQSRIPRVTVQSPSEQGSSP